MNKQVVQLDDNGYYSGQTYADRSPLEPGVWLIPAGCVDTTPPENMRQGYKYQYSPAGWIEVSEHIADRKPPRQSVEQARIWLAGELAKECDMIADAILAEYPQAERLTFEIQVQEAEAGGDRPLLEAVAAARGLDVDELVERVLANRQRYLAAAAAIIGKRQALLDQAATMLDPSDIARLSMYPFELTTPAEPEPSEPEPEEPAPEESEQ